MPPFTSSPPPSDSQQQPQSPPLLSESPNRMSGPSSPEPSKASPEPTYQRNFTIIPPDQIHSGPGNLHPYVRPLTISDLESCVALEEAAYEEPGERGSREKFIYRLTKCGELSLGLFSTVDTSLSSHITPPTLSAAHLVETSRPHSVSVLLAHVIAAKTSSLTATDDSMGIPDNWEETGVNEGGVGHEERGRSIVLHSVAVAPGFQGRGLGGTVVKSYVSAMGGAGVAERLCLIAHDHKVNWYEKLGFVNKGPSQCKFGGGNWVDMVLELKRPEARARYG